MSTMVRSPATLALYKTTLLLDQSILPIAFIRVIIKQITYNSKISPSYLNVCNMYHDEGKSLKCVDLIIC